jgi:hypothetical protein
MDVRMIDESELTGSSPEDVAAYLQVHGWSPVYHDAGGTAWAALDRPEVEQGIELWVPRTSQMKGYLSRIASLLDNLSDIEERSPAQILFEITHSLQDVQRVRSQPRTEPGTIPLVDGTDTLSGIRKWVVSAAASAASSSPTAILPTRRPITVENFMEQVRLAVPEPGSFVWKIAVPLASQDGSIPLPFAESSTNPNFASFNRRATARLYEATSAVLSACEAVHNGEQVLNAFQATVPLGVSANLCEGLSETGGDNHIPFEVTFHWASDMPSLQSERLSFGGVELEVVEQAAAEFRRVEPEVDVQINGDIVRLRRDSEQRPGIVTVAGTVVGDADEKFGHFWFELAAEDYAEALRAHGDFRSVTVQGDIVRRGNTKWLEHARNFHVLLEELT